MSGFAESIKPAKSHSAFDRVYPAGYDDRWMVMEAGVPVTGPYDTETEAESAAWGLNVISVSASRRARAHRRRFTGRGRDLSMERTIDYLRAAAAPTRSELARERLG